MPTGHSDKGVGCARKKLPKSKESKFCLTVKRKDYLWVYRPVKKMDPSFESNSIHLGNSILGFKKRP